MKRATLLAAPSPARLRLALGACAAVVFGALALRELLPMAAYVLGLSALGGRFAGACAGMRQSVGRWDVLDGAAFPNPRAVLRAELAPGGAFSIYIATGRAFVVAPQKHLDTPRVKACMAAIAESKLASSEVWQNVSRLGAVASPEPAWAEDTLPTGLRLPPAYRFVESDPLGKMYVDAQAKSGAERVAAAEVGTGAAGKKKPPLMEEAAQKGWMKLAGAFNGGGSHLDWGTGSSSHFACGEYAVVNAIDSQKKWCAEVRGSLSPAQTRCGAIEMQCLDVGPLAKWGHPVVNRTDPHYFEKYTAAVETFDNPYYDTILVDGRFRTACAIKALRYLRRDSVLLVHDFSGRALYHRVLKYFDVLARHGTLIMLGSRSGLDPDADTNFKDFPESI